MKTLVHKLACAVSAGHILISPCNANQTETISGLLRPLIAAEAAKQGSSWEWEIVGQGGYLMRILMDVTGDDRAELFITTSLTSFKHHAEWRVFTIETNDELRPYDQTLQFAADSVWPARAGGKTILLNSVPPDKEDQRALPREDWTYIIYQFGFNFPGIVKTKIEVKEADPQRLRPTDTTLIPKLEVVLLADYLADPTAPWVAVSEWKTNAHDYFTRPEDAERIRDNAAFTPQAALNLMTRKPAPPAPGKTNAATPHGQAALPPPKSASPIPEAAWTALPQQFPRWPWVAGGIALALVVLSMLKRRP